MKYVSIFAIASLTALSVASSYAEKAVPTLIKGRPADPAEFPASIYVSLPSGQGSGRCTATIVGPQTILLAAHCIGNGQMTFSLGPNNYNATCLKTADYKKDQSADYALCHTAAPVTGVPYENVNVDANRISAGSTILMSGYGCVNPSPRGAGTGGNDGIYRIGEARISEMPSRDNYIMTTGPAASCQGDSGGPGFYIDPATKNRWVIGVNSLGDIQRDSWLSATHTSAATRLFAAYTQKFGHKICGVNPDVQGCRGTTGGGGGGGGGGGNTEFKIERSWITLTGSIKNGFQEMIPFVRSALTEMLDGLAP